MDLGKLIKTRREQLNLTLEQVGDHCGVGKSTVRKWEIGMIQNMRRDKVALLAEILRLDPVDLLDADIPEPEPMLTEEEKRLLRAWRGAEAGVRVLALEMLENHQTEKETENLA